MCPMKVTTPSVATLPQVAGPRAPQRPVAAPVSAPAADAFERAPAATSVFPAGDRGWGVWAWNGDVLSTPTGLDALLGEQKRTGANQLYVNGYPVLGRERVLARALGQAAAAGLQPQVLLGSPDWADPGTRGWLERAIVAPLRTVRAQVPATTAPRLVVHLDVEPHASGPLTPERMRDFLAMLDWFKRELGPGFALQVDVPAWYQGQSVDGQDLMAEVLQRVEGVTLMAYERPVDRVLADVAQTLEQAARLGKQAMVAVEAGPHAAAWGLGSTDGVRAFVATLDAALAGRPGYGGCAVHGLETLGPPAP